MPETSIFRLGKERLGQQQSIEQRFGALEAFLHTEYVPRLAEVGQLGGFIGSNGTIITGVPDIAIPELLKIQFLEGDINGFPTIKGSNILNPRNNSAWQEYLDAHKEFATQLSQPGVINPNGDYQYIPPGLISISGIDMRQNKQDRIATILIPAKLQYLQQVFPNQTTVNKGGKHTHTYDEFHIGAVVQSALKTFIGQYGLGIVGENPRMYTDSVIATITALKEHHFIQETAFLLLQQAWIQKRQGIEEPNKLLA